MNILELLIVLQTLFQSCSLLCPTYLPRQQRRGVEYRLPFYQQPVYLRYSHPIKQSLPWYMTQLYQWPLYPVPIPRRILGPPPWTSNLPPAMRFFPPRIAYLPSHFSAFSPARRPALPFPMLESPQIPKLYQDSIPTQINKFPQFPKLLPQLPHRVDAHQIPKPAHSPVTRLPEVPKLHLFPLIQHILDSPHFAKLPPDVHPPHVITTTTQNPAERTNPSLYHPIKKKILGTPGSEPAKHYNWHLINDPSCGNSLSDRIIGGINATLGQYRWMARIGYHSNINPNANPIFRCGGTLISHDYIVTAAHCVTNLPADLVVGSIRLGEYDTRSKIDCVDNECAEPVKDFKPAQILIPKNYAVPDNRNDIALIRLDQSVKFSKWIVPICLPYGSLMTKNLSNEVTEVAGWGHYDISIPTGSDILQTVKLPVIDNIRCEKAFRQANISAASQMCVGGEVGQDSCNGDSGGPMMKVEAVDGPPRYFLLGIVSFGAKYCGLTTAPAVYTRITSYMHWILNTMVDL